ncbi:MAG TPA: FYDLN acid domain-containing protein [Anaeromyxobacteraceae bacterium]|nr:FYDLN acid domain-containing protein [Anaeromyxobacteraceae bacterium]
MPAKDLGVKYTCWKCGTKFYDLKKQDPACPKCSADPRDAPVVRSPPPAERRRSKEAPADEAAEPLEEAESDDDLDDEVEEPEEAADDDA